MKRFGLGFPLGLAAALILLSSATTGIAGEVRVIPVLGISGQWSDNIFFANENTKSDTFVLVNPGVSVDYGSRNVVLSLGYQAGLQRFAKYGERDNVIQRFDAAVGFNLGRGFTINIVDNFAYADDPLAFDASGGRLQQDSYLYNHFTPGISYTFSGREVMMSFRYDRVDVDYDTLTDSIQNGFIGRVGARLGQKSALTVDYIYFKREFDDETRFVEDYDGQRLGASFDRQLSPRWSMQLYGGWETRKYEQQNSPSVDYDNFVYSFNVVGDFPEIISLTAGFSQNLNDLAVAGAYKINRFNLELRKPIADRVRTSFNLFWQKAENPQINEEFDYLGLRINGEYLVAKFLNVFVGYEYLDRETISGFPQDFTENRFSFGLTVSYGL